MIDATFSRSNRDATTKILTMAQQTAVDWLIDKQFDAGIGLPKEWREQAKAMEKEQIIKAFDIGFGRGHESGENHDWHEGENRGWQFYEQEYLGKQRIFPDDYPEWAKHI